MKILNILTINIVLIITTSCDPESCVDYLIYNDLSSKVILRSYKNSNIVNQEIEAKTFKSQLSVCDMGSSPSILQIDGDSIQVIVSDMVKKTYYPNDTGKSIYKTQDRNSWQLVESKKNFSKFVFEIKQQDLQ